MDEARSLQYSIKVNADTGDAESRLRSLTSRLGDLQGNAGKITVNADTSGAESGIRGVTSSLGGLKSEAGSVGSAFRSSFLAGIDSGDKFSTSLKAGIGGAFSYVGSKASEFAGNVASTAQSIGHGFAHPIETIKNGLGNALQSAKEKFIDMARGAEKAASGADSVGEASDDTEKDVTELGDAADKTGERFGKFGDVLKGAGTAIAAVSAAAIAGAVALGTQVVKSYADYEQLVGGIDTLFGGASKQVQTFAANAYATAGLSANQYMELTTSFSSSLIQSLGGDTAKAAAYADQAITDMADNANKMGTSIDTIQNAYRGFSMQNYTMLDNLKLGYGGTQAEMERLLADAGKIAGTKFDISSYADITEAIHVIQTEMGIAGATAAEAADTISGSAAATKAAFQNLITGLGNKDADIGQLVDNVVVSFKNVVKNVTPIVENLAAALPTALGSLIPAIGELLPSVLTAVGGIFSQVLSSLIGMLPELIPVAVDAITLIAQTLIESAPLIIDAALALVDNLVRGIADLLPMLVEAAVQIAVSLATGLGEALPTLIPIAVEAILNFANTLIQNVPLLVDAALQLISGLADGIVAALPIIIEQIPVLIESILTALGEALPMILEQGGQILTTLLNGIIEAIPLLLEQLPEIISGICNFLTENLPIIVEQGTNLLMNLITGIVEAIPVLVEQLPSIISAICDTLTENLPIILEQGINMTINLAMGIIQAIPELIGQLPTIISSIVETLTSNLPQIIEMGVQLLIQLAAGIIQAIPQLVAQLPQIITAIVQGLGSLLGGIVDVGKSIIQGLWQGISNAAGWLWEQISGWASGLLSGIKGFFGIHSPSTVFAGIGGFMAKGLGVGFVDEMDDVEKDMENSVPTEFASDISYGVNAVVGDVDVPKVSDVSYNVTPIAGDFNPPDTSASVVYNASGSGGVAAEGSEGATSGSAAAFAPVININVQGAADGDAIEDMRNSLYSAVRELFQEFREEELERMTLKNQFAY